MIEELWPTSIVEDELVAGEPVDMQLLTAATQLAKSIGHQGRLQSLHSVTELATGDTVSLGYQSGIVRSLLYEQIDGEPDDHHSGAVLLHDPRAAAGMVIMPGLPWGRPHTVTAVTGRYVVFPSWLSWTILPVAVGHRLRIRSTSYFPDGDQRQ